MNKFSITIPGQLPDLNTEINAAKKHWAIYSNHKKKWTEYIGFLVLSRWHKPTLTTPVTFNVRWYAPNAKKDKDNCAFALKYIQDGFVVGRVIKNDGWKDVLGFTHEFFIDKDNPRVEIDMLY